MKKSVSLSRICLVVCIVILLATAIVTSPLGSLLPVFGFVALLAVIPLVSGKRTQKVMAAVIIAIAVTLIIVSFEDFKLQRQRLRRMRKTHIQYQISAIAQSNDSFQSHSSLAFCTLNTFNRCSEFRQSFEREIMPVTPFHLGPGIALKSVAPRHFSFTIFAFTQILIDLEALYYFTQYENC